jgi:hypothetical protein
MPPQIINNLTLIFHGDTKEVLNKPYRNKSLVSYPLNRRASIKDIIESLGVPHTEIGCLLNRTEPLPFTFIPVGREEIHVYPLSPDIPVTSATLLRPTPLVGLHFMVDININKLAHLMRMAGIDTSSIPSESYRVITQAASDRKRILLSRNKDLLKYNQVIFGRLIRSQNPNEQFAEVVKLYALAPHFRPFSRCMLCNAVLVQVEKTDIKHRLEPLTKKHYTVFKECPSCNRLFWRGSHYEKMVKKLETFSPETIDDGLQG